MDCTYEESVERQPDDISTEHKHHQPHLHVLHGHDQPTSDALVLGVGIGLTDVLDHPQLGDLALLLGEAARVVGQVGKDEDGGDGDGLALKSATAGDGEGVWGDY